MRLLENLKLDTWYGITLYIGMATIFVSLYFVIDFLGNKHLFGFGLGLLLVGLSQIMAEGYISWLKPKSYLYGGPAIISTKIIKHNLISIIIMIIGICLILLFGYLIIKSLV